MGCHVHYNFSMLLTHCCKVDGSKTKVKVSKEAPLHSTHIHTIRRMNGKQIDGQARASDPVPVRSKVSAKTKKSLQEMIKKNHQEGNLGHIHEGLHQDLGRF